MKGERKPGRRAGELQPEIVYDTPKTRGSRRRVPLTPSTVAVLRDYLAAHPRADELDAPLFPTCSLRPIKPTGKAAPTHADGSRMSPDEQAATATVAQAEARLLLDWTVPLVHRNFYGTVYRPAVLRANLNGAKLLSRSRIHSLRHTYAQLVHRCGHCPVQALQVHGTRQHKRHVGRVLAPFRGRPHRRDGGSRGDGPDRPRGQRGADAGGLDLFVLLGVGDVHCTSH